MNEQRDVSSAILVIEDNPAQLTTLIDILENEGFHPMACITGGEALEKIRTHDVHVAILDLRLPDMNGLDVLKQLKQIRPHARIIINTAYASLESAMEAVNREAFAYVQKMGDVNELLRYVHRAFRDHFIGYSNELENEVRRRTAELEASNAALNREIDERRQAEERLKVSLREKEVLLRELYHRTKNNMQVICSMLGIQASYTDDPGVRDKFEEMEHKIQAMSLVHQKLYQSGDLSRIDLREYIRDLTSLLMKSYRISSNKIALTLDMEDLSVLIDTAIPCGLVLNELISNTLKHAFPGNREGEIRVSLKRDMENTIELHVSDNGVGVAPGFDFRQSAAMGLRTVTAIVEHQLQGNVMFETGNGVACRVRFSEKLYSPSV